MPKPYWSKVSLPRSPKLTRDLTVDVAIIGGGITGLTAAYLAGKAGLTSVVLERDRCGQGDTCCTTAHVTYVTDTWLSELAKTFGKDHARGAWESGQAAINQLESIINDQSIECNYRTVPAYLHGRWQDGDDAENEQLHREVHLAGELGFPATFVPQVPMIGRPGMRIADQARFHPLMYLRGVIQKLPDLHCQVFEHSEATGFQDEPLAVIANGKTVYFKNIFIATHVPLMGLTGTTKAALFQSKLTSYSSYAIGARLPHGTIGDALYRDNSDPYYYLRLDVRPRHDYVIFGGADHKTGQHDDPSTCHAHLEKLLGEILPDARVLDRWSGQVVETFDGLPLIGEIAPNQFIATGFAGNGMTFGVLSAMMAIDHFTGAKNPWSRLYDVGRKKLSSVWDYLTENLDYPYYYLKDKLGKAEGKSLRAVKRGEGRILSLDGRRVAVYRDNDNKVTQLSPACTHMGCVVRWNNAESTWDCPCHGSRFGATGEVIAGPAEKPLEMAE